MKRIGLIFTTIILFGLSLYAAYAQGASYPELSGPIGTHMASPLNLGYMQLTPLWAGFVELFSSVINGLTGLLGGSLMASVIVLALLVELITLYPAVNVQLKQKKIHLFHKKLVDRFRRGELTMSKSKHELDVLYSVNERIHRRGAVLVGFQLLAFVLVLLGLNLMAQTPFSLAGAYSIFNTSLFVRPEGIALPVLAGMVYLLHSLVKIHLKQREDYIGNRQMITALGFALLASWVVFSFATTFPVLLSVYFMTQITFATMRYIVVEENAKAWGKYAQRELIKYLRTSRLHKNKVEHWSRKFNHLPLVRNLNFHLLEEALSMSLVIIIALNGMTLI